MFFTFIMIKLKIFKSDDIKFMIVCNNLLFSSKEIPANAMFIKNK